MSLMQQDQYLQNTSKQTAGLDNNVFDTMLNITLDGYPMSAGEIAPPPPPSANETEETETSNSKPNIPHL